MTRFCWFWRSALARQAVVGVLDPESRLARHLERCQACAAEWEALRRLTAELPEALPTAAPSDAFAMQIWERLQTRTQVPPVRHRILVPAAFCAASAALLILFVMRERPQSAPPFASGTQVVVNRPPAGAHRAQTSEAIPPKPVVAVPTPGKAGGASGKMRRAEDPLRRYRRRRIVVVKRHRHTPYLLQAKRTSQPQNVARKPLSPETLVRWGYWYEVRGDYRAAKTAYERAFAVRRDPAIAFAAGRAAESAGDVAQALSYYNYVQSAQLHRQPSEGKPSPKEGTSLWNETSALAW